MGPERQRRGVIDIALGCTTFSKCANVTHLILTPSAEPSGILVLVCPAILNLPIHSLTPCVNDLCSLSSERE